MHEAFSGCQWLLLLRAARLPQRAPRLSLSASILQYVGVVSLGCGALCSRLWNTRSQATAKQRVPQETHRSVSVGALTACARGAAATAASLALGRFVFLPFQRDNAKRQGLGKQNGVTHPEAGDKFAQEASFALNTNDPAGFNLIDVFAWGAVRGRPWTQRWEMLPSPEVHSELQRLWSQRQGPCDLLPYDLPWPPLCCLRTRRPASCIRRMCCAAHVQWAMVSAVSRSAWGTA